MKARAKRKVGEGAKGQWTLTLSPTPPPPIPWEVEKVGNGQGCGLAVANPLKGWKGGMGGGQGTAVPWPSPHHPLPPITLRPGRAVLVWGESVRPLAAAAAAWGVAWGARVLVVDAANLFDPYRLVREARRRGLTRAAALSQVQVARAFTSHQLVRLVREELPARLAPGTLVVLLGPVSLFYDEQVPLAERRRLFQSLVQALAAVKRRHPLLLLQPSRPSGAPNQNFGQRLMPLIDLFLTASPSPRALSAQKRGDH